MSETSGCFRFSILKHKQKALHERDGCWGWGGRVSAERGACRQAAGAGPSGRPAGRPAGRTEDKCLRDARAMN